MIQMIIYAFFLTNIYCSAYAGLEASKAFVGNRVFYYRDGKHPFRIRPRICHATTRAHTKPWLFPPDDHFDYTVNFSLGFHLSYNIVDYRGITQENIVCIYG